MENLEILKNIFIFSGFDKDGLTRIHGLAVEETHKKTDPIYWEGDAPDWLFIVIKGKVKLFKQSKAGKETILRIVGAGETFGEVPLFDGRPHSDSAKAMEPTDVLKIPRTEFLGMVREHPYVAYELILEFSRRLRDAQDVVQGLAVERVEKRIVNLLLKLADRIGRGRRNQSPDSGDSNASGYRGHGGQHRGDHHPHRLAPVQRGLD
ncbi:MAG: Crp/Fnr family transcriptional regulator [Deltaproteobacteria bacterium]|nr:Crp/Fnr family transcriptional regulator [Deltaproteobacteria bacterium]